MAGDQLHAFVEIPKGSRNKYEYDAEIGHVVLDRTLWTSVVYPADYGYLMGTMGRDGDPVDAMILVAEPTFPGCVIPVEPIGVFEMRDEAGDDDKVLCVRARPDVELRTTSPISAARSSTIGHFFEVYRTWSTARTPRSPAGAAATMPTRSSPPARRGRWSGVSVRAAVIEGPTTLGRDVPRPDRARRCVLRMHFSGICGTDKHT